MAPKTARKSAATTTPTLPRKRGRETEESSRAPRAIWNGTISFGLVSIPVRLYTATQSHDVHFHLLHKSDGVRLQNLRWCPKHERAVPWDEVVRGFEYAKGQYVPVTNEDLEHLPVKTEGCTSCHTAHGGTNPRLLRVSQTSLLCLQCHTLPTQSPIGPAHNLSQKYQACTMCHTAVHGSNSSNVLFK